MYLKCERDGSAKFSPEEEAALDRELKELFSHMANSEEVVNLITSIMEISPQTIVSEVQKLLQNGSLPSRINQYGKLYLRLVKAKIQEPKYDYYYLHYESGSDRYSLTDSATMLLRKSMDGSNNSRRND